MSSVDICRYSYRVAFMLTGRLFVLSDYSQRAEVNEERESSAAAAAWKEEEVSYEHLTECCDSFDELRWHKQKGVIAIMGEWVSERVWVWVSERGSAAGTTLDTVPAGDIAAPCAPPPPHSSHYTQHSSVLCTRCAVRGTRLRVTPALRATSVLARGESEPVTYQHSHRISSIFPSRQFIDTDDAMKCSLQ